MPILDVIEGENSFQIAQSIAIARYLAKRHGLAGKSDLENVTFFVLQRIVIHLLK